MYPVEIQLIDKHRNFSHSGYVMWQSVKHLIILIHVSFPTFIRTRSIKCVSQVADAKEPYQYQLLYPAVLCCVQEQSLSTELEAYRAPWLGQLAFANWIWLRGDLKMTLTAFWYILCVYSQTFFNVKMVAEFSRIDKQAQI